MSARLRGGPAAGRPRQGARHLRRRATGCCWWRPTGSRRTTRAADADPGQGRVLTQLSVWWFEQPAPVLGGVRGAHHLIRRPTSRETGRPGDAGAAAGDAPRRVRGARLPVGLGDGRVPATGAIRDVALPPGLVEGSRLPSPVFTPSTKAEAGEHDEASTSPTSWRRGHRRARELRELTLALYARGRRARRGRRDRPRRHEVRVRARRRRPGARRRGADAGLVPLLARRDLVAR